MAAPQATGEAAIAAPIEMELVSDEVRLGRGQLDSGLALLAERTLRRLLARLDAASADSGDAREEARAVLAEALWQQQRPVEAGRVLAAIHPSSPLRRRPISLVIEAEAAANAGHGERAQELMDRVLRTVGVERAWELRGGIPSRLPWPAPPRMRPLPVGVGGDGRRQPRAADRADAVPPQRAAAARARLESARDAFAEGDAQRGEEQLAVALRLDRATAPDALALLEPQGVDSSSTGRLLLYGDLLHAVGRHEEASAAYARAADDDGEG